MRRDKTELETRVEAVEDARRHVTDQLAELTTEHQRAVAKQVPFLPVDYSTPPRYGWRSIVISVSFVCVSVFDCQSVRECISGTTRPILSNDNAFINDLWPVAK